MRLKNYRPAKNEVLLELKHYNNINGIITPKPQADKIMRVLAVGPMCTATKVGDLVLMSSVPMVHQELELDTQDEKGKPNKIVTLQGMEYNIMAYYHADPDEDKYHVVPEASPEVERQGPQNIIDNPGIDQAPFLKEQDAHMKALNLDI